MDRWMRMYLMQERESDPGSPGSGGNGGELDLEDQEETLEITPPSNTDTEGASSPFKHPSLAGLTEEQIAERLSRTSVLEATVREQGSALTELSAKINQPQAPPEEEEEEISSQDFFADPGKNLRKIVEKTVKKNLEEMITPFRENLATQGRLATENALREAYPDYDTYKPLIENMLAKTGAQPTEATLKQYYFTAKGYMLSHGETPETPANPNPSRPAPPQHRASGHPTAPDNKGNKPTRELTENERTLARSMGMTPAEYLRYQQVDEEDVLSFKDED